MTDQDSEPPSEVSHGEPVRSPFSSEEGGEWEDAGRVIGRFAGKAGSLFGKASEAVKSEYKKSQQREGGSSIQKIWDQARDYVKKGTEKENVARLKELAFLAKENTSELSEGAAKRIARIYTDCTGNSATAAEVRQVALRFGVMALVTFVTSLVLGRAGAAQNLFSEVRGMAADAEKADFDGNFEEHTAQFYSDEGGAEGCTGGIDADAVVADLE